MVGYYNGDLQTAGEVESCYIIAYHFISLIITRGICKKKKKAQIKYFLYSWNMQDGFTSVA